MVIAEMEARGYKPAANWKDAGYRGKRASKLPGAFEPHGEYSGFREHNGDRLLKDAMLIQKWIDRRQPAAKDVGRVALI